MPHGYTLRGNGRAKYEAVYCRQELRDLIDQIAEPDRNGQRSEFDAPNGVTLRDLERYSRLLQTRSVKNGSSPLLLDAGAGLGKASFWFSAHTHYNVIAADYSITACKIGIKRFGRLSEALQFIAADLTELPFSDCSFSATISIDSLYLIPRPDLALSELARVISSGGILIFSVLSPTSNGQTNVLAKWTDLLKRYGFSALECTDTSASWRAEMRRRHMARWARREQISAALGKSAVDELMVSRTMLGLGGSGPTIDSTLRTELLARRT